MSYVLAIEPNPGQAGILREIVGPRTAAGVTIVESIEDAMTAIDDEVPNLVILNALIPPRAESQLVERLRNLPQAPQILFTPTFAQPETPEPRRRLVDRFRKRRTLPAGCHPSAFADLLSTYLHEWRPSESLDLLSPAFEKTGAERRASTRFERVASTSARINDAVVGVVDLSLTGAQIVSSVVLHPGKSVEVMLSNDADAIRCEAGIVWSAFEVFGSDERLSVRAGINFKAADRDALERLYLEQGLPRDSRRPADEPSIVRGPADLGRPRAARHPDGDATWLSTVKLPGGFEARPLNISTTGMLLESGSKVTPGSIVELTLSGPEWEIAVRARFVRSDIASVNGLGVNYHIAAVFQTPLEFPDRLRAGGVRLAP